MRRMRRIGLVLIDERRGRVLVLVDVVGGAQHAVRTGPIGGPRQHHEAEVGRKIIGIAEYPIRPATSGSSGLERNEDRCRCRPW